APRRLVAGAGAAVDVLAEAGRRAGVGAGDLAVGASVGGLALASVVVRVREALVQTAAEHGGERDQKQDGAPHGGHSIARGSCLHPSPPTLLWLETKGGDTARPCPGGSASSTTRSRIRSRRVRWSSDPRAS